MELKSLHAMEESTPVLYNHLDTIITSEKLARKKIRKEKVGKLNLPIINQTMHVS